MALSLLVYNIIKFLVKEEEEVKPAETLCRLNAQYGEETLSHASGCVWYSMFYESHTEVLNLLHAHVQPTAVHSVNIHHVEELILGNRRIAMHDMHPTVA
jgi:hypothetical protein